MYKALFLTFFVILASGARADTEVAYFAGGCFWCMESNYQEQDGVLDVVSGFTGGTLANPTYKGNHEGHFEAIKVTFNPEVISYRELLDLFWVSIDPFDNAGQFCDKGFSYRSAIFPADTGQRALAEQSKQRVVERFPGQTVHTEIRDVTEFWPVEEYHQDYYLKNPVRYNYYRWNCGRDQRTKEIWGEAAAH
ncbi:peptide-methionine (S)-S-oxide reductase MsrA [Pseudohalioglobus sediminis]|uniref:Peptide methionine sulfoxide reductase MsrA n=1 Tax=Pseudohalioglobus sediminis TaxID=2606449 RepID=A0A5B0X319_9GAMM|nr:peptide-methionine (S)-S-oxide reductase MsrA [Pseudohalioglobus sediminis]KAA1192559.1 peptide-methionine (S)-S-oxide reductase MsrA [Pseudohalioglobus sediminis]